MTNGHDPSRRDTVSACRPDFEEAPPVTILGFHARSGTLRPMVDREKVLAVLRKRFPEASVEQTAAAANAIVGIGTDWREIEAFENELLPHLPAECPDPDCLVARLRAGGQFKLLERVPDFAGD
jgi:hypothetical protein